MTTKRFDRLALFSILVLLSLLVGFYFLLDWAAIALYPLPYTLLYLLLPTLLVIVSLRQRPLKQTVLIVGLFWGLIFTIRTAEWNSRKPFLKDLFRIEMGMTMAEVDDIMAGYMRAPVEPGKVSAQGQITYRHTNEGWADSDWGLVTFQEGRVIEVRFLPD